MFPSFYFINSNVAKMLQLLCSEKAEKGAQRRDIMEEDKILIFFFGAWSVEIPNSSKPPLPPARSTNLTIPGMLTRSRRRSMAFQGPSSDRPDDAEADVGILNVDVAAAAGASIAVAVDNDTNNDDDTLDLSTSLYDVHVNLQYVTSWSGAGSCCASDRADGTTTTPALPSTLGLRIDRVGDLPLPLSDFHAKLIKSNRNSREIEEKTHHGVHSVPSKRIHIHNPAWKVALEQMVRTVAYKLGVAPKFLSAELKMLLLMEKGSRIDRCSIDSGGATVMGTLFIQLPSVFTGGKVGVFVPGGEDSDGIAREETSTRFDLGVTSGESAFSCYFVCHYGDCEFEIAKIQSGSRVLLQYSLHYSKDGPMPTGCSIEDSMVREIICSCWYFPLNDLIKLITYMNPRRR